MSSTSLPATLAFGPFVLHVRQKLLTEGPVPVRIGSRALELLAALLERAGEVVSRDELVTRVWPRSVVEETSLRVHVSALRKALGCGHNGARYIANVPGRGYSFVASVATCEAAAPAIGAADAAARDVAPQHNLPPRLTRQIGRSEATAVLCNLLDQWRLVSVVGPGGMGKTTVALAVAEQRLADFAHGVRFVDLSPLTDGALVAPTVGTVLGVAAPIDDPWPVLHAHLRDKRLLIVLDNCEHVIEAAAVLADRLLKMAPGVRIVATSREPLDTEGERVHRLAALQMPAASARVGVEQAATCPAVQLFVERAMANSDSFVLDESTLEAVLQVCHRLDGIPLAIELAAARVDGLGVHGLAARLDDVFELLTRGRRTAFPRHKTLQAVLDWSYRLLDDSERVVLQRLSIFRAGFTFESAAQVVASGDTTDAQVIDAVMNLMAKSLVAIDNVDGDAVRYRLLYTTRQYAARHLQQSGDTAALAGRHAAYFRDLLAATSPPSAAATRYERTPALAVCSADVRAALDWALLQGGDAALGVSLTVAAMRAIYEFGRFDEYRRLVELALEKAVLLSPPQPELEMRLLMGLSFLSGHVVNGRQLQAVVFPRMLERVRQFGNDEDRAEALYAVCVGAFGQGEYRQSAAFAEDIRPSATGPLAPLCVLLVDRLLALNQHFLGQHDAARRLALQVLASRPGAVPRRFFSEVPTAVSMRIVLSRIAWIEGQVDQAAQLAAEALQHAAGMHPFAMCQALGVAAIPVALWRGDWALAGERVEQLIELSAGQALSYWHGWATSYRLALRLQTGAESGAAAAHRPPSHPMEQDMLATLAPVLLTAGALQRVEEQAVGWCAPETLRAQGETLLALRQPEATAAAEAVFQRALALAQEQRALSWELRIACSLARLWRQQGRRVEGQQLLRAVYARFGEGHDTADLVAAKALLSGDDRLVHPHREG